MFMFSNEMIELIIICKRNWIVITSHKVDRGDVGMSKEGLRVL